MEFLELLLALIGVILLIAKPQKERLAFTLVLISWGIMAIYYIGHKSNAYLTIMNL